MKLKYTILFTFLLLSSLLSFSQNENSREKIEAMKVAFITQELSLTTAEAQLFWPVYNDYEQKKKDIRKDLRQTQKGKLKNLDQMSDKEIEEMIDLEIEYDQKELDLKKEYHSKLKKVLSMKKIALLYKTEDKFKRKILEQLKNEGK